MKRRGQKEHLKQGDINKTNLYLNNTYNETFKNITMVLLLFVKILSVCVYVWLRQLKLQKD